MVIKHYIIGIIGLLFLASCNNGSPTDVEPLPGFKRWQSENGYYVDVPEELNIPSGTIGFFTTVFPPRCENCINSDDLLPSDYIISVESQPTTCESTITAAEQMTPLKENDHQIIWGKVHKSMKSGYKQYPNALCKPPISPNCSKTDYWSSGCQDATSAYVLCSEKDDKRVLICISQMTDNPELAKQIFDTFKWIDE